MVRSEGAEWWCGMVVRNVVEWCGMVRNGGAEGCGKRVWEEGVGRRRGKGGVERCGKVWKEGVEGVGKCTEGAQRFVERCVWKGVCGKVRGKVREKVWERCVGEVCGEGAPPETSGMGGTGQIKHITQDLTLESNRMDATERKTNKQDAQSEHYQKAEEPLVSRSSIA